MRRSTRFYAQGLEMAATDPYTTTDPADMQSDGVLLHSGNAEKTSRSGWGGPRPGFGGPQPGSGRPRKPIAPPIPDTARWRVFAVWGQAEVPTARELTQLGYDAYMPLVAVRRRDPVITTMWHTVRVPLLPGYGFVRLTQAQPRERILEIRGVRELLRGPDGRLAAVSDAEIDAMRTDDESRLQLPKQTAPALKVGAMVRIEAGPFTSFLGRVLECDGVKTRVAAQIFGRETPVWLDRVAVVVA